MKAIIACTAAVLLGACAAHRDFESSRDEYVKDWEFRLSRVVRQAGVRRDLNGLVTVRVVVFQDGRTESFGVLRTSGNEALDHYALQFPSMRQYDACRTGQEASCQRFPMAPASVK